MNDRLKWLLARRRQLARSIPGFSASLSSYATSDCQFEGHNRIAGTSVLQATKLGRASYVNSARLNNALVGRFCSIGIDALIGLGEHPVDRLSTHPVFYSPTNPVNLKWVDRSAFTETQTVVLGSDVWIGARSIVLSGVKIGDGAIIAAGAVVTHDVPAFAIVAGLPARVIRSRFDEALGKELLQLSWRNAPMDKLQACAVDIGRPLSAVALQALALRLGPERDASRW